MPQFDQFSFTNQVFWLIFFFLNIYFLTTYFFIPKLSFNLKFRKKKIKTNNKNIFNVFFEKTQKQFFLNNFFQKICFNFDVFLKKTSQKTTIKILNFKNKIFKNLKNKKNLTNFFLQINTFPKYFN